MRCVDVWRQKKGVKVSETALLPCRGTDYHNFSFYGGRGCSSHFMLHYFTVFGPIPQCYDTDRPHYKRPGSEPGVQHSKQLSMGYGAGNGTGGAVHCTARTGTK